MTKLTRFFGISLLVVSVSGAALADGGETQGAESQSPAAPAQCTLESTECVTPIIRQDSSADLATVTTVSLTLLAEVIW